MVFKVEIEFIYSEIFLKDMVIHWRNLKTDKINTSKRYSLYDGQFLFINFISTTILCDAWNITFITIIIDAIFELWVTEHIFIYVYVVVWMRTAFKRLLYMNTLSPGETLFVGAEGHRIHSLFCFSASRSDVKMWSFCFLLLLLYCPCHHWYYPARNKR